MFAVTRGFRKTEPKEPSRVKTTDPVLFQKLLAEAEKMEKSGNLTRAVQLYEKAIALNPEHPASYISLGLCYEKLERPEKAAEVYERSLRMNPNQPDVLQMLSNLKREEKRK